jgi:hypothetical protein
VRPWGRPAGRPISTTRQARARRTFSWKAAHYLDKYNSDGHAIGANVQSLLRRTAVHRGGQDMQSMGVNALDKKHPLERYLREAAVFPLYDAGNIGMQMRKIWGVMMDPDFDPRAFADCNPITFKISMEGAGLEMVA